MIRCATAGQLLVGGLFQPCPWTAALPGGASNKPQASSLTAGKG